ncbi:MAG TPA: FMN-binding negative transcriptional regulator [Flavisolibacter sp.]|nr:FMN-binding negative transcriptional regulator [Flavisolibacter sp.]
MYVPNHYMVSEKEEIVAFMKQYSFATIVTAKESLPTANHLPFTVQYEQESIRLLSHFSKANKQWETIVDRDVLVIFSEPHAYISPKHYDNDFSVPTWNYVAVHAYGKGRLLEDVQEVVMLLEEAIRCFEPDYKKQWDSLPQEFKLKNIKGIVAFEIQVQDLQAKKKLSQNKNREEQMRIVTALSQSDNPREMEVARYMQQSLEPYRM